MMKSVLRLALVGVAAVAMTPAAFAQKAKDTIRIGFQDQISTVDPWQDPKPETIVTSTAVFDTLVAYDPAARDFKPVLAESWARIDDKTLEFKLRQGIKFHDGSEFSADDVVATLAYVTDPNSKLRFGNIHSWIARTEKIDRYTVRIVAKERTPYDLMRLSFSNQIMPAAILTKLTDKSELGRRTPVGTGPYRVESIDASRGIMLVKNPDYKTGSATRPGPQVGRIEILPIPDMQTEIAQLITGGIDVIYGASKDQTEQLAKDPRLAVTPIEGIDIFYVSLDAVNRSGNEALSKQDVRKALMMAIDRQLLAKNVVAGGDAAHPVDGMCVRTMVGCDYSNAPPPYNLAEAKKLLAAAGYPNGFPLEITSQPGAQAMAEAVGGELRKLGLTTSVDHRTFVGYREKQTSGKIQALVAHWDSGGTPDVTSTMNFFFSDTPRNYWRDQTIAKLAAEADLEMDPKKRQEMYRQIFNRNNDMNYVMPLVSFPAIVVHSKDVKVGTGSITATGIELNRLSWK
jgi:peptide/nickel transport system substrate-binding protein